MAFRYRVYRASEGIEEKHMRLPFNGGHDLRPGGLYRRFFPVYVSEVLN